MKEKKIYQAPKIQRVQLVIKNAVLGTCHASPNLTPQFMGCGQSPAIGCWDGPGY